MALGHSSHLHRWQPDFEICWFFHSPEINYSLGLCALFEELANPELAAPESVLHRYGLGLGKCSLMNLEGLRFDLRPRLRGCTQARRCGSRTVGSGRAMAWDAFPCLFSLYTLEPEVRSDSLSVMGFSRKSVIVSRTAQGC